MFPGLSRNSDTLEGALLDSWLFTSQMTSPELLTSQLCQGPAATSLPETERAAVNLLQFCREHAGVSHLSVECGFCATADRRVRRRVIGTAQGIAGCTLPAPATTAEPAATTSRTVHSPAMTCLTCFPPARPAWTLSGNASFPELSPQQTKEQNTGAGQKSTTAALTCTLAHTTTVVQWLFSIFS